MISLMLLELLNMLFVLKTEIAWLKYLTCGQTGVTATAYSERIKDKAKYVAQISDYKGRIDSACYKVIKQVTNVL